MRPSQVFQRTGSLIPGKSVFDLSYDKKFTCDMGQLIPVLCDEMVPGDYFELGNSAVIRFQPMVAPVLHEINFYVHYYFVPYRLMWDDWEDFITGGTDGQDASVLPRWTPTNTAVGSLWDFLGFPTGVNPTGALPLDFPRIAYNMIYNEYYRDETLITEVALTNETILNRCWEKDYFTSALPWQQRGISPALPITGSTSAVFGVAPTLAVDVNWPAVSGANLVNMQSNSSTNAPGTTDTKEALEANTATVSNQITKTYLDANTVDLSSASPFDLADFRVAFQIQKWMERNARAGARYIEFLNAHFGVAPKDDRLQRPEYIGGSKTPVIISEVLQTSETDTSPQGNLAGHGISVSQAYCGKYHAKEFGVVVGIMSVMPRSLYQQGINRQWLRTTRYDFYFTEFANLSEQAIEQAEIYATGVQAENQTIFGYQGRYDEMRTKQSMVCSEMRSTFDYWHISRQFAAAPTLNGTFVTCTPRKDIFADAADPGLIVSFGNIIKATRPIPIMGEPGLIDHH